jgi:hypothetical protein
MALALPVRGREHAAKQVSLIRCRAPIHFDERQAEVGATPRSRLINSAMPLAA